MARKKGILVEMLVEGQGGELIFKPVEFKKESEAKKLLETKNTVIRENLKRALALKKD